MERLEACYFCGTAADAPLREVSLAPRARRGDPDATVAVTMCPTCEGKLETVLDHLFEHVETRRSGPAEAVEDDAAAAESGDAGGDPATTSATDDATTRGPGGVDRVDRIDVASRRRPDRSRGRRRRRGPDGPTGIREVGSSATDDGEVADGAKTGAGADAGTGSGSRVVDADAGDDDGAEVLSDESVRARATATADDLLDGVSVAEYNRVLRLLQNREFPIERAAFVDLAANAYDLGEDAVEQVLDAVIERGSLAERGGDLVRPGAGGGPPS